MNKRINLIRHADKIEPLKFETCQDKLDQIALSNVGRQKAYAYGQRFRSYGKLECVMHSGVLRTEHTAMEIASGYGSQLRVAANPRLAYKGKFSQKASDRLIKIANDHSEAYMVKKIVAMGMNRYDVKSFSAVEIGMMLLGAVYEVLRLISDNSHAIVISHSGLIECLEATLVSDFNLDSLGGPLDYLEGISFYEYQGSLMTIIRDQKKLCLNTLFISNPSYQ